MKTTLRPHKVLGQSTAEGDLHALVLTEGPFSGIIFSYSNVTFTEEDDTLKIGFEYYVHDTPYEKYGYDKSAFEKELGDFLTELLYYGLERDHLGFIPEEEKKKSLL
jgi:hypothetical protein